MSIFSSIRDAIFGGSAAAATPAPGAPAKTEHRTPAALHAPSAAHASISAPAAIGGTVDVAAILDARRQHASEDLDWRRSIVDLMKLLDLDSSLPARRELAKELGYGGDVGDTAEMNVWLHKQVMVKLAEHGGTVPPELAAEAEPTAKPRTKA